MRRMQSAEFTPTALTRTVTCPARALRIGKIFQGESVVSTRTMNDDCAHASHLSWPTLYALRLQQRTSCRDRTGEVRTFGHGMGEAELSQCVDFRTLHGVVWSALKTDRSMDFAGKRRIRGDWNGHEKGVACHLL